MLRAIKVKDVLYLDDSGRGSIKCFRGHRAAKRQTTQLIRPHFYCQGLSIGEVKCDRRNWVDRFVNTAIRQKATVTKTT